MGLQASVKSDHRRQFRASGVDEARVSENHRKMTVVHLATRLTLAGVGNVVKTLVMGFDASSYSTETWCLEDLDVVGEELRAAGRAVLNLQKCRRRDLPLFFRLATLIRQNHVDILHCHDELSWFYGTIGARFGGLKRIVFTVHGRRFDTSARHTWEQSILGSMSAAVVCVSSSLRQEMIEKVGISSSKAIVIRNGTPIPAVHTAVRMRQQARRGLRISDSAIVIGSIGRLDPVKNLDLLLEASADVLDRIPNIEIILAGEGPSKEKLLQKAVRLGISNKVHFLGLRKDVPDLLSAIDIYTCTSDREGISLSILEAMAAERAIIATAVGGNLELIESGKTGLLIDRGDRPALAGAIAALANDTGHRQRLGRQAAQAVETNFSVERMLLDYDRLYHSLISTCPNFDGAISSSRQIFS